VLLRAELRCGVRQAGHKPGETELGRNGETSPDSTQSLKSTDFSKIKPTAVGRAGDLAQISGTPASPFNPTRQLPSSGFCWITGELLAPREEAPAPTEASPSQDPAGRAISPKSPLSARNGTVQNRLSEKRSEVRGPTRGKAVPWE